MSAPGKGAIIRPEEQKPIVRGGGAMTWPLVGPSVGSTSMLNGITVFEPGASIPMHSHNCEESVMLIEGEAIAVIDGVEHRLKTEDTTFIPANVPHRFINASSEKRARIFWIYASVDATRTMVATGETRPILAEHQASRKPV